jgi:hypothetical protein
MGFDPLKITPSVERFSAFLHDTPNDLLQDLHHQLVNQLLRCEAIKTDSLAIDSCPVPATVKENNRKTRLRSDRFDKNKPPKGDPEAGLGVFIHFSGSAKKVAYFWGYRNHIVSDPDSEIPLLEATVPANVPEVSQAVILLGRTQQLYGLSIRAVLGDAEYDAESILRYIVEELHARPYIPRNPRSQQTGHYRVVKDQVLCQADLPMVFKGHMTVNGITYIQYRCPLYYSKRCRERHLFCPAEHPKYIEQKGCNALIRQTPTIRSQIPYGSQEFRQQYNKRTAAERIFSRLLSLAMQRSSVHGLPAVQNYCTIAHITTCLVALTAYHQGHPDKLRFVRTFVPDFLS